MEQENCGIYQLLALTASETLRSINERNEFHNPLEAYKRERKSAERMEIRTEYFDKILIYGSKGKIKLEDITQ